MTDDLRWQAFPARQLTGTPHVYHAYVGRGRPEQTCGHDHRRPRRAEECARRLAHHLNAMAVGIDGEAPAT